MEVFRQPVMLLFCLRAKAKLSGLSEAHFTFNIRCSEKMPALLITLGGNMAPAAGQIFHGITFCGCSPKLSTRCSLCLAADCVGVKQTPVSHADISASIVSFLFTLPVINETRICPDRHLLMF